MNLETLKLIGRFMGRSEFDEFVVTPAVKHEHPHENKDGEWILWAIHFPVTLEEGTEEEFISYGRSFVGNIKGTKEEIKKLGFKTGSYFK